MQSASKFFLLFLLVVGQDPAAAFSFTGHFIIANCAWYLLDDPTKVKVQELLGRSKMFYDSLKTTPCTGECTPLGEAAKWADDVRDEDDAYEVYGFSDYGHYLEVPDDEVPCPGLHQDEENKCWFDYDRDCPNEDCSAAAIVSNSQNLMAERDAQDRRLFFLDYIPFFNLNLIPLGRSFFGDEMKENALFLAHFIGGAYDLVSLYVHVPTKFP